MDRLEAELFDRGVEGVVEDELLDKLRGLEQGIGLAGGLGEILVEVPQEPGVPLGVGEVVVDSPSPPVWRQKSSSAFALSG